MVCERQREFTEFSYRLSGYGEVYWEESRSDNPCRSMSYIDQRRASRDSDERLGGLGYPSDAHGGLNE